MREVNFRSWLIVALLLLVLMLVGCVPGTPGSPIPSPGGSLALRVPRASLASFRAPAELAPLVRLDSLYITATWLPAVVTDQYGPIDSILVGFAGGYPSTGVTVWLPATATSASRNLPFNLNFGNNTSGSGPDEIGARVCVNAYRRNIPSPAVCRDAPPVVITWPAPPSVSGLTVTSSIRPFPED